MCFLTVCPNPAERQLQEGKSLALFTAISLVPKLVPGTEQTLNEHLLNE